MASKLGVPPPYVYMFKELSRASAFILSSNIYVISNISEKLLNYLAKSQAGLQKMEMLIKKSVINDSIMCSVLKQTHNNIMLKNNVNVRPKDSSR